MTIDEAIERLQEVLDFIEWAEKELEKDIPEDERKYIYETMQEIDKFTALFEEMKENGTLFITE